jgi:hypothetical protein
VVDALDRVERQLRRLREELTPGDDSAAVPREAPWTGTGSRVLPLLDGAAWPADPDAAPERIDLPAWLARDASWALRVGVLSGGIELQPGDLALIRRGQARSDAGGTGRLAAVLRQGKLEFAVDPGDGTVLGIVVAFVRRLELDQ